MGDPCAKCAAANLDIEKLRARNDELEAELDSVTAEAFLKISTLTREKTPDQNDLAAMNRMVRDAKKMLDDLKTANFGLKARIDGLVDALKRIQTDHPTYELVDLRAIARTALRTFGMDSPGRRLVDGEIHGVHRNAAGEEIVVESAGNCLDLKVDEGLILKVKLSEDFDGCQAYVWIETA